MEWSRLQLDQRTQQVFFWYMRDIGITPVDDIVSVVDELKKIFDHDQEYGLLNRLDTVTSGLLYMAKTPEVYASWKQRQTDSKIQKYYLASTEHPIAPQDISVPLWHHTNGKKMIVADEDLLNSKRKQKIKWWHLLKAQTCIINTIQSPPDKGVEFDKANSGGLDHQTHNLIKIHKGRRHQIRAHLAYIWHPILGEKLYADSDEKYLQLYSIGCKVWV